MATYCKNCDIGLTNICDYCKYFNHDDHPTRYLGGYGCCELHKERKDAGSSCPYFYCYAKDGYDF